MSKIVLERISTAVPWPRGLAYVNGKLFSLARGIHRGAGGPNPDIEDYAGAIFEIDPTISEEVSTAPTAGSSVEANGKIIAPSQSPPFNLWDSSQKPPTNDIKTDRPYATLVWDESSENFFICGFAGIDLPVSPKFRKNASDSIHRFDTRDKKWRGVESHDWRVVPPADLSTSVPNHYYPHTASSSDPLPHGLLNGPNGLLVIGKYLYAVAKDNSVLVRYNLTDIQKSKKAGFPKGKVVLGSKLDISSNGKITKGVNVWGHSCLAYDGSHLYIGFRTTSQLVRIKISKNGTLPKNIVAEKIAQFDPYTPGAGSSDLLDIAINSKGVVHVSTAKIGQIWKLPHPFSGSVFDGTSTSANQPLIDLRKLSPNARAKCGNIVFDELDRIYICCGNKDSLNLKTAGVIYRAFEDTSGGNVV